MAGTPAGHPTMTGGQPTVGAGDALRLPSPRVFSYAA